MKSILKTFSNGIKIAAEICGNGDARSVMRSSQSAGFCRVVPGATRHLTCYTALRLKSVEEPILGQAAETKQA